MTKFEVNDSVLYGAEGVCRIADICEQDFMGTQAQYYVLKPVYNAGSTVFVPVENETLVAKMRRILSPDEIRGLIKTMPDEDTLWIDDDNTRRARYAEIVQNGDRAELVGLIKALYRRQQEQQAKGRKLHAADERYLREAEKVLYDEFAHVLRIKRDEVLPFIMEQIQVKERA